MYRTDLLVAKKAVLKKTLEGLAEETGLDDMTISDILNGKPRNFGIQTIEKVAVALEVPLADLFSNKEIEKAI